MLATAQEYAADKLPETVAAELKRAHARYLLEVLRTADQQLRGTSYAAALARIAVDFANFEAGIRESQESGDDHAVVGYASSLADHLRIKGRYSERLILALAARTAAEKLGAEAMAGADNNLGNAYGDLPTGDRGDNLRRAIACYEAALRVRTEARLPAGLGDDPEQPRASPTADLPTGDRGDNLGRAIACYEAALRVCTEARLPAELGDDPEQPGRRLLGSADGRPG